MPFCIDLLITCLYVYFKDFSARLSTRRVCWKPNAFSQCNKLLKKMRIWHEYIYSKPQKDALNIVIILCVSLC